MNLNNVIKSLRKKFKMSQQDLANKLGVSRSAVNMWEKGDRKPSIPVLNDMADFFDVDLMYLLGFIIEDKKIESKMKYEVPLEKSFINENELNYNDTKYYEPESMVKLPIVGQISCGKGHIAYEEIEGYESIPSSWLNGGEYFFLRAKGDSMINARIHNGDLVLIRHQPDVEDGEIAAVLINNEAVLKRVYKRGNTLLLQSENPEYPPMVASENIIILGKLKKIVISL